METYESKIEFTKMKTMLAEYAHSDAARGELMALVPLRDEALVRRRMDETTAARRIMEAGGNPPLAPMREMEKTLALAGAGAMLGAQQLNEVRDFLVACGRMQGYLRKGEATDSTLAGWDGSFFALADVKEEIERCIRGSEVDSFASPALRDIRRRMQNAADAIQGQLAAIAHSKREYLSDGAAVMRGGRYVLAVKRAHKTKVSGSVVDMSGTGGTLFIEPSSVAKHQQQLAELRIEEENEVRRILYTLTALVDENASGLKRNMEAMVTMDVLFAKAALSIAQGAGPVCLTVERRMDIINGRHPLIAKDQCVPLSLTFGQDTRGLVITGPNTGGKTVAIKTVALLHAMAQCGLHVTAQPQSTLCLHSNYLCDVGDGQSITENLSTFSAHITNIIEILNQAGPESLVLLDELGSGTDPAEGMGIAVAVMDALLESGCMFLVTTHYPELKQYAEAHPAILNARMAFDAESLRPTYRLEPGKSGESCALHIARRLGFPPHLLARAQQAAYPQNTASATPTAIAVPKGMSTTPRPAHSAIRRAKAPPAVNGRAASFGFGDSVLVYPARQAGIVFHTANERGEVGVQVQKHKQWVPHKRLKLVAKAADLYPPDYDFAVVFDSVDTRKAHKQMQKRHTKGLCIQTEEEKWGEA